MAWLRAKTCVLVLFGLITFGQAYPYSYAWAEGRHAQCGCNESGRKCIHGCDLKKKRSSHDHHAAMGHGHHGHHGTEPAPAAKLDSPDEDSRSLWVSPDCSKQKKREVLDFRGDPFVPQMVTFFLPLHSVEWASDAEARLVQRIFLPDPPPPKA
ncbi:MAG TPA: hypothetical protein VJR29_01040 [bacterium]|nr:hypothetical protein [bacterium]